MIRTATSSGPPGLAVLPSGVLALAETLWRRAGHRDGTVSGAVIDPTPEPMLERMLYAPLTLEPDWPTPAEPLAVKDGFVVAELVDEDQPLFEGVLEAQLNRGPEAVAAAAQELRLPVSPYRRPGYTWPHPTSPQTPPADLAATARTSPELATGATVIDLTTHWAGPLATSLLADAGATVIKIDPDCRPDGFRDRTNLYSNLNDSKDVIDLDLRTDEGRRRFEQLLADADLLVESFSRRVMGNLGYGPAQLRALAPNLATLSIKAFPAGSAEEHWLGYGPGIHAVSGLAFVSDDPGELPTPSPVAYPDFLTGLTAYGQALQLLGGDRKPNCAEVSLLQSVQPLLARRARSPFEDGAAK